MYYQEKIAEINSKLQETSGKTVVWPCGGHTNHMLLETELWNYCSQLIFVDEHKKGSYLLGKRIYGVEEIEWCEIETVIISSLRLQGVIQEQLSKIKGFSGKIITLYGNEKREFYELYDAEHGISWGGDYTSMEEVGKLCGKGYASENIPVNVMHQKYMMNTGQPDYYLIAQIFKCYMKYGKIIIVDLGGAFGSQYFRNKLCMIDADIEFEWCIVELPNWVEYGKNNVQESRLHYFLDIDEIKEKYGEANYVIYARSSLQYFFDIDETIDRLSMMYAKQIIVDDTPMADQEHFVLQSVRDYVFEQDLAVRIFGEKEFIEKIERIGYCLCDNMKKIEMRFSDYNAYYKCLRFKQIENRRDENG